MEGVIITVCPRSSDPFYVVTYYIKWVTTSWTHSNIARIWTSSLLNGRMDQIRNNICHETDLHPDFVKQILKI